MSALRPIRRIKSVDQLGDAVYYSEESEGTGKHYKSWTTLYNERFEKIEDAYIAYTSILDNLTRIVRTSEIKSPIYAAYDLTQLNDDFYKVESNEDTLAALRCLVHSIHPNKNIDLGIEYFAKSKSNNKK